MAKSGNHVCMKDMLDVPWKLPVAPGQWSAAKLETHGYVTDKLNSFEHILFTSTLFFIYCKFAMYNNVLLNMCRRWNKRLID